MNTGSSLIASPTIWRLASSRSRSVVVLHEGAREHHLYCIHSVTGDVAGLSLFASYFGRLRLHGIQVPRSEMTAEFGDTIEAMARRHVTLLAAYQPDGPIRLIGWSAGAIVALEMARQLRALGREVPLLVALDGAPCNTGAGLRAHDPRYVARMIANLPRWFSDDRATSDWSIGGIRRRVAEKLAARRGTRRLPDIDTLEGVAVEALIARPGWSPAQKAFVHKVYQAMSAYVPQAYDGPVVVFETGTQPLTHLRQIGAAWRAIANDCEIVPVRGNHSGLILDPTAAILAAEIVSRVDARGV